MRCLLFMRNRMFQNHRPETGCLNREAFRKSILFLAKAHSREWIWTPDLLLSPVTNFRKYKYYRITVSSLKAHSVFIMHLLVTVSRYRNFFDHTLERFFFPLLPRPEFSGLTTDFKAPYKSLLFLHRQ